MPKTMKRFMVLALLTVAATGFLPPAAQAELEWKVLKDLDLKATPLALAAAPDGRRMFILTPGEVCVYSVREEAITDRIPVGKDFDRIAVLLQPDRLVLSSSAKKTLQVILLETVHTFDMSGLPFKGREGAPVTIAVFTEYQCPYCAQLEPLLHQVLEKYPKDVKLVMKHYLIPNHPFAKKASMAALAAARQDKFWEMHEKLYAAQKELNDARIDAVAQEVGLDLERYHADLNDPQIWALIVRDMNDGRQAEVRGTPTIFINGKLLNQRSLAGFEEAIEAELQKKK